MSDAYETPCIGWIEIMNVIDTAQHYLLKSNDRFIDVVYTRFLS